MKANIKLDLKSLTPTKLAQLMSNVAAKLDGNPHFPAPPISSAALKAEEVVYSAAIAEATHGSLASKKIRDELSEHARDRMRYMANYVRMMAQGQVAVLATSGFELAKVSGPPQPMGTPTMAPARMSRVSGEVKLRWSGVPNRRTYHVYMTTGDPSETSSEWTLVAVTGRNVHYVPGLESYKPYWFCVSAVGALGEGFRSNVVVGRAA